MESAEYEKFVIDVLFDVCNNLYLQWGILIFIDTVDAKYYGRGVNGELVAGSFIPPNNQYSPEPVIVMFPKGCIKVIQLVAETNKKCNPMNPKHVGKICMHLLKHEYRHFQQWFWLDKNGFSDLWIKLVQLSNYWHDPLEDDANRYAAGNSDDIDNVMACVLTEAKSVF
jgi:hypothetical protein